MSRLVLAEKPSQARAYGSALGATQTHDGYIEGNGYTITWGFGHLVELANAEVYDERYKKWNLNDLPIIPKKWEYVVPADKKNQFAVVKKLMSDKQFSEVIVATDAGREGELIGRLMYEKAGCKLPMKRAWLSSMEDKAIVEAFNNTCDGSYFVHLYQSALCRSRADWICGISFTRAFSVLYNKKLTVGRVQTPTLAMIAERNTAIVDFKKEKFFNVHFNNVAVISNIGSRDSADNIVSDCNGKSAVVKFVDREKKSVNPPKLYDLTTLQREANRLYGFTAQQTLDYAQSLYESRLLTYPRTSSRYLPDDMADTASEVIGIIRNTIPLYRNVEFIPDISRVINSKKINDHFALCPTAELAKANLGELPDGERKILEMVCNKLLCATADKHEYESVISVIECSGHSFTAKSKTILNDGWKAIERLFKGKEVEDDSEDETVLDLQKGQKIENAVCNVTEHYTKPKAQFTEDTLLSAMERAGVEEITESVEFAGLGTPATRASIIEKLIKSGFVKREKKNLVVTEQGAELISLMPETVKSAKMTADWENSLALIAKGEFKADYFMTKIEQFTNEVITQAKSNIKTELVAKSDREPLGVCPRCGKDIVEYPKSYSCISGKEGCGFAMWKNNKFFESAKKAFTKEIAVALLKDGKCDVNGLYSAKTSKTYNATVCLDDTGDWVNFRLEFNSAPKTKKAGRK